MKIFSIVIELVIFMLYNLFFLNYIIICIVVSLYFFKINKTNLFNTGIYL